MTVTNAPVTRNRGREHYRPPVGVPRERRQWWGAPLSTLAHLLLLLALLFSRSSVDPLAPSGAGGPGPAGGGGGGAPAASPVSGAPPRGERLSFVRVAPPPPTQPVVEEKKPKPVLKPVVQPPKPVVHAPPEAVEPVAPPQPTAKEPSALSATQLALNGTGAGDSGASGGAGQGTGGGVGTGTGTGRGSANGPGTGGGEGEIYPATPDFLVMPALPVPSKVRGKTVRLVFEIDASGKITSLKFDSTGDSGYDRELRDRLMEYRFRPAHRADGTPVASTYVTELTL